MNILALDLATKTGWALYENGRIESGVQDFSKQRGESNGMLFLKFNRWLEHIGSSFCAGVTGCCCSLDLIVFEQAHHRGGAATEIAVGLMTRVLEFGAKHNTEHAPVHSMTLKKWVTGSGKADKEVMKAHASLWIDRTIQDDNEADAILLLCYALEKYGEGNACNARPATAAVPRSTQHNTTEQQPAGTESVSSSSAERGL